MNSLRCSFVRADGRRHLVVACVLTIYLAGSIGLPRVEGQGHFPGAGCECGTDSQQAETCCCVRKRSTQKSGSCCQKKIVIDACCSKKSRESTQDRPTSQRPLLTNCNCSHESVPGLIVISDPQIIADAEFLQGSPVVSPVQMLQLAKYSRETDRPVTPPPEGVRV